MPARTRTHLSNHRTACVRAAAAVAAADLSYEISKRSVHATRRECTRDQSINQSIDARACVVEPNGRARWTDTHLSPALNYSRSKNACVRMISVITSPHHVWPLLRAIVVVGSDPICCRGSVFGWCVLRVCILPVDPPPPTLNGWKSDRGNVVGIVPGACGGRTERIGVPACVCVSDRDNESCACKE